MSRYVLYLDESETFTSSNDHFFSVAGVIIENNDLSSITNDLDNLKNISGKLIHWLPTTFCTRRKSVRQTSLVARRMRVITFSDPTRSSEIYIQDYL